MNQEMIRSSRGAYREALKAFVIAFEGAKEIGQIQFALACLEDAAADFDKPLYVVVTEAARYSASHEMASLVKACDGATNEEVAATIRERALSQAGTSGEELVLSLMSMKQTGSESKTHYWKRVFERMREMPPVPEIKTAARRALARLQDPSEVMLLKKTILTDSDLEEFEQQCRISWRDSLTKVTSVKREDPEPRQRREDPRPRPNMSSGERRPSGPADGCDNCGWQHPDRPCPASDKECRKCGKIGHFGHKCRSTPPKTYRKFEAKQVDFDLDF